MSEFFAGVRDWFAGSILAGVSLFDVLDIVIISILIYQILKFFKNTRAIHLLKGVAILIVALAIASRIGLPTVTWLLSSVISSGLVIVIILFQPELRRGFENIGRVRLTDTGKGSADVSKDIDELVTVCEHLSRRRVGALMVFAGQSSLDDIIETGTALDARISAGLIENVFEPNTPLHDGAMIIKSSRIVSAGCFLPLSENNAIEKTLGTRHRAALGVSERTDVLVIIVSEETGVISAAREGRLRRYLDLDALRKLLGEYLEVKPKEDAPSLTRFLNRVLGKEEDDDEQA